jgi:hypothetical protein
VDVETLPALLERAAAFRAREMAEGAVRPYGGGTPPLQESRFLFKPVPISERQ